MATRIVRICMGLGGEKVLGVRLLYRENTR